MASTLIPTLPVPQMVMPGEVERRRGLAEALLARGMDTSDVASWAQGFANLAESFIGARNMRRANEAERQGLESANASRNALVDALLGGGQPANDQILAHMNNPWAGDGLAEALLSQRMAPPPTPDWGFVNVDGTIYRTNNLTGEVEQAAGGPTPAADPDNVGFMNVDGTIVRTDDAAGTATPVLTVPSATTVTPRPMTAAERLLWGIPADDPRVWAMGADGPSVIGGNPPSGTTLEVGADGTISFTQGTTGLNMNQAGAMVYAGRMQEANEILNEVENVGTDLGQQILAGIPIAGNFLTSPEYQRYQQAQRNFITAVLRRESGAVITPEEFATAAQYYFPQPGDGPEVIEQKRHTRQLAIDLISAIVPEGGMPASVGPPDAPAAPPPQAPADGDLPPEAVNAPAVTTADQYNALPAGAYYYDDLGNLRQKP